MAVETGLKDAMIDFRRFIETECEAFLSIVPYKDDSDTVHIGHEIFREYLGSGEGRFFPQQSVTHAKIARVCIDLIFEASLKGTSVQKYMLLSIGFRIFAKLFLATSVGKPKLWNSASISF